MAAEQSPETPSRKPDPGSGGEEPVAPRNDVQPSADPDSGTFSSLSDADFDALFSVPVELDNNTLCTALNVSTIPEDPERGLLHEALKPRLPAALWNMVTSGRASESPLGMTESEMPVSLFEFRRGSQWIVPDAEMLAAPMEPDIGSGASARSDNKKRVTTAVVTHSGRVDDSALERSTSPVKVALTQLPIEKGGGLDIAVQVNGMQGLEELLSKIDAARESPEHYRASIARYELDRRVRDLVIERTGHEIFGDLDYIDIRRAQGQTADSATFNVVLALPPNEFDPDAGYRAIEIKGLHVSLGEARLLRFAGGSWKDAGLAGDYEPSK
jgi:hypothetical protein